MIVIDGPAALDGELKVQGAKNSTLPLLAATVLCKGQTVLHNCPHLSDVDTAVRILEHLGSRCQWQGDSLVVDTSMTCCQQLSFQIIIVILTLVKVVKTVFLWCFRPARHIIFVQIIYISTIKKCTAVLCFPPVGILLQFQAVAFNRFN